MVEAVERLVNLAFFLAAAHEPVSREQIRSQVDGYGADQDDTAFMRMFERDKDDLRDAGLVIETVEDDRYRLDADATFAREVALTPDESAALRAAGAALANDEGFPFAADLRLALAKLSADLGGPDIPAAAAMAEKRPAEQARLAAALADATSSRKAASFDYTTAAGVSAPRELEPYGLFARDGRWYVVGRDRRRDALRVFALERMSGFAVNTRAAKTPDFEVPDDFDVAAFIMLPFQYGPPSEAFDAIVRFSPAVAWRAPTLSGGRGVLEPDGDEVLWRVTVRDRGRLLRFVLENGPGLSVDAPAELRADLAASLHEVVSRHA